MRGKMASPTARASGCGIGTDLFDSEDFTMMDSETLQIRGATSTLTGQCGFSHDPFSLAGEPYLELDTVTRSFDPNSAAGGVFKMIPNDHGFGMVLSDDALAAWRGHEAAVNLGYNNKWLDNPSQHAVATIPFDDAFAAWTECNAAVNLDCNKKSLESHSVPYSRKFRATDVPPEVPSNVDFLFLPLTYRLRKVDAPVIANMLLDFLTAKGTTTITKESHAKFSIKVSICIDGSDCVAKLRMYSNDAKRALALELQRRSGCALVFNRFYQEVGSYLAARQKSVQFELLNFLEGDSSPVCANADVGTYGCGIAANLFDFEDVAMMAKTCT